MTAPITFPRGVRLTFEGYLPAKECRCRHTWPAAAYAKRVYLQNRSRWLEFGALCLHCDPPLAKHWPADLNGVRPTSTYRDIAGARIGWRERDRTRGCFGPELPLELMGLRRTADGVWRPQPKLDRRSTAAQLARPAPPKQYRALHERRTFTHREIVAAVIAQRGVCLACDAPFTPASPAVGGHEWPYADGWPTDPSNCVALHAACNASMGRRSLKQFLRDRRRLFRGELFPDT